MIHTSRSGPIRIAMVAAALVGAFAAAAAAAEPADRAMIAAAKRGDWAGVARLLEQGASAAAVRPDGATALHWASYRDHVETAALLIRKGASVNAANYLGATPLWLAAENGSSAMIRTLLGAGANPNAALLSGETPLMVAARTGNVDVVRRLLASGANPNAKERTYGDQTALMWAISEKHPAIVDALLAHGADVQARTRVWTQTVKVSTPAQNHPEYIVDVQQGGNTPLLFAAQAGDLASARLLIAAGANVNDTTGAAVSVTTIAAHSGHGPVARLLLEKGADPNAAAAGYTALHAAILREDETLVEVLLAHGANPNAPLAKATPVRRQSADHHLPPAFVGATPLWLAARFGLPGAMRVLAKAGADPLYRHQVSYWNELRGYAIGRVNEGTITPLMAAAGMGFEICACPTEQVDSERPSRAESEERRLAAVTVALELGVDPNVANADGDTALHFLAGKGYDTIVRTLAEKGARLDVRNAKGQTPLDVAKAARGREKTAALLQQLAARQGITGQ